MSIFCSIILGVALSFAASTAARQTFLKKTNTPLIIYLIIVVPVYILLYALGYSDIVLGAFAVAAVLTILF